MRTAAFLGFGSLAVILAASPAISTSPTPATYFLAMEMHDGDRLVGSPRLNIAGGEPATVQIGDTAGNSYTMSITATPQNAETVAINSTIAFVSADVHRTISLKTLVSFNKRAAFTFGANDPTSKPFRVTLTISKLS